MFLAASWVEGTERLQPRTYFVISKPGSNTVLILTLHSTCAKHERVEFRLMHTQDGPATNCRNGYTQDRMAKTRTRRRQMATLDARNLLVLTNQTKLTLTVTLTLTDTVTVIFLCAFCRHR